MRKTINIDRFSSRELRHHFLCGIQRIILSQFFLGTSAILVNPSAILVNRLTFQSLFDQYDATILFKSQMQMCRLSEVFRRDCMRESFRNLANLECNYPFPTLSKFRLVLNLSEKGCLITIQISKKISLFVTHTLSQQDLTFFSIWRRIAKFI